MVFEADARWHRYVAKRLTRTSGSDRLVVPGCLGPAWLLMPPDTNEAGSSCQRIDRSHIRGCPTSGRFFPTNTNDAPGRAISSRAHIAEEQRNGCWTSWMSNAIRNCPLCVMKNCPRPRVHDLG